MGIVSDILKVDEFEEMEGRLPIELNRIDANEDPLPTKQELDEHIEENIHQQNKQWLDRRQKQAESGDIKYCDFCTKFKRTTPNQRSRMGNCRAHGVMVMDTTTECEVYILDMDTLEYAKAGTMRL